MKTFKILLSLLICGCMASTALLAQNTTNELPKKAKLKTIKYKELDYAIIGYVHEKEFVEGQKLSFLKTKKETGHVPLGYIPVQYNKTTLTDTIISGVYVIKDGISYLESNSIRYFSIIMSDERSSFNFFDEKSMSGKKSITKGLYKVTNSKYGNSLTAIPAEASTLKIEIADIYFYQGYYTNAPVTLQKQQDNYLLKIEFNDKTLETIISSDTVKKYRFLSFDKFIQNSKNIKLNYNNGDIFIGTLKGNIGVSHSHYPRFIPNRGEYKFANGEIYIGDMETNKHGIQNTIPTFGKITFTDNSIEEGNWLKKYNVTSDEISKGKNLTEMHNIAIRLYEEKQKKQQEEKIAKEQAEERKLIAKQERKNTLINKYGDNWANLILKGKYTVGMTPEMVKEMEWGDVFGNNNTQKISTGYVTSISTSRGQKVEIWELNPVIANSWRGTNVFGINAYDFNAPYFPTLVFTNGKLTDIYR